MDNPTTNIPDPNGSYQHPSFAKITSILAGQPEISIEEIDAIVDQIIQALPPAIIEELSSNPDFRIHSGIKALVIYRINRYAFLDLHPNVVLELYLQYTKLSESKNLLGLILPLLGSISLEDIENLHNCLYATIGCTIDRAAWRKDGERLDIKEEALRNRFRDIGSES